MSIFDDAVDLYRGESLPMMRDHFFRLALIRMTPTQVSNLIDAMTDPMISELREAVAAGERPS